MADKVNNVDQNAYFVDASNNNDVDGHKLDIRDGMNVSSSARSQSHDNSNPYRQDYDLAVYQEIPVPENADSMIKALFVAINLANYMILA